MEDIMIYGAGKMGRAACRLLDGKFRILAVLDRDARLKYTSIDGRFPVINPEDKSADRTCRIIAAMTACTCASLEKELQKLGYGTVVPAGEFLQEVYAADKICFANLWTLKSEISEEIYRNLFSDELSGLNWGMAYEWFAYGTETAYRIGDRKKYFPDFLEADIDRCRVMLDTAALNGEYVDIFLEGRQDRTVYAMMLSSSKDEYDVFDARYASKGNVHLFDYEAGESNGTEWRTRAGLMEPFTSLNPVMCRTKRIDDMEIPGFDYLRCYSMDRVEPVLKGARTSIKSYRPLIAVNIGHYESDFIRVPILLSNICEDYKFYFRVHSYQGNDCIMYAVPFERKMTGELEDVSIDRKRRNRNYG